VLDRPYVSAVDVDRVLDVLLMRRTSVRADRYPTMYRLRMLLISRLWSPEQNAHVWSDKIGRLLGCALLLQGRSDSPRFELVCLTHPYAPSALFTDHMLPWALSRGYEIAQERAAPITLEHAVDGQEAMTIAALERNGFARRPIQALYMARSFDTPLPEPILPTGFTLRAPVDEDEIDAYLALYNEMSTPLSRTHRLALMDTLDYSSRLDLVAVASDSALAAFCECSIDYREGRQEGRQVGWIEHLGTRATMRRLGLGRAMTLAGLHRLRANGARTAILATHSANTQAQSLYTHLGFKTIGKELWFVKDIADTASRPRVGL